MHVPKYVIAKGMQHEPAFTWCVHHHDLKERDRMITLVKQQNNHFIKRAHLFLDSIAKDGQEGNSHW